MPYRRLPNTDQARLRTLKTAVQRASDADFTEQPIPYRMLSEVQQFLLRFETEVCQYHDNYNSRVTANKQYRHQVATTRMYISHFIQVLNMAVQRGEIHKDKKKLYHLDPDENTVPDLTTEEDLLKWGQWIIDGEQERTSMGGFPIYNPAINKVKVHYDIFKENQCSQTFHRKNTNRTYENVEQLRKQADQLIVELWNVIEGYFATQLPYQRLCKCKSYGVIYYYRTGEKRLTPETDQRIADQRAKELTLQWSE